MYCKYCNVTVLKGNECPLCHEPLEPSDSGTEMKESGFQTPEIKQRYFTTALFLYMLVVLAVSLICLIVNLHINPSFAWSVAVLIVLSYSYYCLKRTVVAQKNFHSKLLGQVFILTLCCIAVRVFLGGNDWLFITWLPCMYFVSELLLILNMAVFHKSARKSIIMLLLLCVMGFIPVLSAYLLDLSVKWPSIAVACFSAAEILATLIVGRKKILGELKRFFHL